MSDLRIALLQADLVWENSAANLLHFDQLLELHRPDCDLLVLPEMFSTGFSMRPHLFAGDEDGPEISWMQKQAAKWKCQLAGSLMIKTGKGFVNRLLVVGSDGILARYDKKHLFSMAGENELYQSGNERVIHQINGWRINLQICYDLRFPVWARNRADYDLLLYVANWPSRRIYAWKQLLLARAIENQCYVAGVNRVGVDGNGNTYTGGSSLINPMGEPMAEEYDQESMLSAVFSKNYLIEIREKLPFLQDRDDFNLLG